VTRIALLVIFVAVVAGVAHAASVAQPPLRVVGFSRIGAFHVPGGNPAQARKAFGRPLKTNEIRQQSCEMSWSGVQISFYTLVRDTQCRPDTPFGSARVTRPWVTDRGLRQGDTVARARRLYPDAGKRRPSFAGPHAVGLIVRLSEAIGDYGLAAIVDQGRLKTLVISDPQGGE
jgi:hypothetical protein